LVVETTNFNDKIDEVTGNVMRLPDGEPTGSRYYAVLGTADTRLVERFTRVDADTLDYRFTVTAPNTFARPWTAAGPLSKLDAPPGLRSSQRTERAADGKYGGVDRVLPDAPQS
jgi:hypothetical protein